MRDLDLKDSEVIDDLQIRGYKIIQDNDGFKFGIDAVLLSNFVKAKRGSKICELGTGTGVISLLIHAKNPGVSIDAVEIQKDVSEMANRSILLNGVEDDIRIINGDVREIFDFLDKNSYDIVVSNPPYMSSGPGINKNDKKAISRHEITLNVEDIFKAVSGLLNNRGRFFMIHRPNRLADIMYYARKYRVEPKVVRYVHPKAGEAPNMVLISFTKGANPEIIMEKPLIVYNDDGSYTDEIIDIYDNKLR